MRKDPPRNTEVYNPGVILTYELLQIPVHTIAYLQVAVLTYKLGL